VQLADRYQVPVYVRQQQVRVPVNYSRAGLLEVRSDLLRISAIKKHAQRDTLICRVYNLSGRKTTGTVVCGLAIRQVWQTDLLENRLHPVTVSERDRFTITLMPFEIMTLEIKFSGRQRESRGAAE
jgi:alpha-mannosidase